MDEAPDTIQTLWLVRGSILILVGLGSLIAVFISVSWQFYLLGALGGLGIGSWEIWPAVSSMRSDEQRRVTSPARVERAETGLSGAGWENTSKATKDSD